MSDVVYFVSEHALMAGIVVLHAWFAWKSEAPGFAILDLILIFFAGHHFFTEFP